MTKHDLPVLARLGEDLHRAAQREIGRPPWRRRRVAFAVPALGVAALVAVLVVPGGSGPGAAERAYAAMMPGDEILHVVQEVRITRQGEVLEHARYESWTDGDIVRSLGADLDEGEMRPLTESVSDGRTAETYLFTADELRIQRLNPIGGERITDPFEVFRRRFEADEIRVAGETRLRGRPVVRLVAGRDTWFVDRETGVPVEHRMSYPDDGPRYVVRYLVNERVPYDPSLLRMSPHPGAERTEGALTPLDVD